MHHIAFAIWIIGMSNFDYWPHPFLEKIRAKYQKNVEAYHNRSSSMKHGIVPSCIRSESYMITFEVEEEKYVIYCDTR